MSMNEFHAKSSCRFPRFILPRALKPTRKKTAVYNIIATLAERPAHYTEMSSLIGCNPRLYSRPLSWLARGDIRCPAISHLFLMRSFIAQLSEL